MTIVLKNWTEFGIYLLFYVLRRNHLHIISSISIVKMILWASIIPDFFIKLGKSIRKLKALSDSWDMRLKFIHI